MKNHIGILAYGSCKSFEFLLADFSKKKKYKNNNKKILFWIVISISKDTGKRNLSFIFVICASDENKNSWV